MRRVRIMKCEYCKKEFTEKYSKWSDGRFCSKDCARKFSRSQNKIGTKIVQCISCGKEIEVNKRASDKLCKCKDCKEKIHLCKICGLHKCLRKDICKKSRILPALIKYFGFDKNVIGTIKVYEEFDKIVNLLKEDYIDNHLSSLELAKKYKHSHVGNFNKILDVLDIRKRSLSEASLNAILNGNLKLISNPKYKHGWHTTWKGKKVFYRSSYELDYAKYLDKIKIDYEMEKLRIVYWDSQLQKQRIAIPDFYLANTNEIVEIKSKFTFDEQNMKDKFKAYKKHGYKVKLILEHKIYTLT